MGNSLLELVEATFYRPCGLVMEDLVVEAEGQEYGACRFRLGERRIVCRNGKVTPKKLGQFVTFWKRDAGGVTAPWEESDPFDFYVVNVRSGERLGQIVFPKAVLVARGIVSSAGKAGKRGFRVYPAWDVPVSRQAVRTQGWQLGGFGEDWEAVKRLYP